MVVLDAVEELLATLGVPDVLNTDVDPLLDVAVAHDLVDDDADGVGCNVVDNTGTAITSNQHSRRLDGVSGRTRGSICGAYPFAVRRSP